MKDLSQASQGMSITDILIDKKKPEDIPPEQAKALEEVCSGDPKISAEFLSDTDDPLVRAIYTITEDGEVVFPLGNGVDPQTPKCHGHLGEHRSDWHKESVGKHTAVVVSRSCRGIGCRRSTEYVLTVLIAFFHDLAKKYLGRTNKKGGISFLGHAQLSAYFAMRWLEKILGLSAKEKLIIVIAVYSHDIIGYGSKTERDKLQQELKSIVDQDIYESAMRYTRKLVSADVGVRKVYTEEILMNDGRIRDVDVPDINSESLCALYWSTIDEDSGDATEQREVVSGDQYLDEVADGIIRIEEIAEAITA